MDVHDLRSRADAEAMLAASEQQPVWLFKHSATCPISAMAHHAFLGLEAEAAPRYRVVVQQARDVSTYLAERLDVRHESPQAVLVGGGQALYVANHMRVQTGALRAALAQHTGAAGSEAP